MAMAGLDRHEEYGPLIDSYAKSILDSGLLLDEDLEVFVRQYSFQSYPKPKSYRPPYVLTASIASILPSLFFAERYGSMLWLVPSSVITASVAYSELQSVKSKRERRRLVDNLLDVTQKNHLLNANIVRYLKTRLDVEQKSQQEFFTAFNSNTEDFMKTLKKTQYNFIRTLMDIISRIASFSDDLMEDYNCIKQLDAKKILKNSTESNIEQCLNLTKTIKEIHIWLTSKLLSYLGIIFCSKSSKLDKENFELFLSVRIPHILTCLKKHHEHVGNEFKTLQHSIYKLSEFRSRTHLSNNKHVSNKLRDSLFCCVNNIQVIFEKSQNLLEKFEQVDPNVDGSMDIALIDMRDQALATYESLSLLCRLYGILSKTKKEVETNVVVPIATKSNVERSIPLVNHDDEFEAMEEKYELYLSKNTKQNDAPSKVTSEDQSAAYMNLMLDELKQSLKKHERFIEAKKRRGSADNEEVEAERKCESPPKFNLQLLNNTFDIQRNDIVESGSGGAVPSPPTPPEGLLEFIRNDLGLDHRTMLENIKELSRQRNSNDEVFEISSTDSLNSM